MAGKDSKAPKKYPGRFPLLRLRDLFFGFPERSWRLIQHLRKGRISQVAWWTDAFILGLDWLGLGISYEVITWLTKWNLRPLDEQEHQVLYQLFGDTIDYERIRIDERAYVGPRQVPICYVSFYTINSWGPMQLATLVHETVHIWQYERVGAAYIPRALRAQRTAAGYDYGGFSELANAPSLWSFNYEQQADIVADYWCLREGHPTRWLRPGENQSENLGVFERLLRQAGFPLPRTGSPPASESGSP